MNPRVLVARFRHRRKARATGTRRGQGSLEGGGSLAPFRRARLRLAVHYAAGLCAVAALTVGGLYLVLANSLDVETTTSRTVNQAGADPAGSQVREDEEVTVEVTEEAESRVADRSLDRLRDTSLLALAALLVGSLTAGWLIAGRVLTPIEEIVVARQRFIRDTSHELRNPLTLMRTSLDLALEDPTTPDTTWREVGNGLRSAVDRMSRVVDSLLQAARDEASTPVAPLAAGTGAAGAGPAGTMGIDPRTILREVATQIAATARAQDLDVVVDAEPAARPLPGDQAALTRAVANLVDNAVRHAPAGSSVILRGEAAANGYEIRVEDAGPGIAPDEAEAVFERGHRSPDSPGLGLGLAIARDIVDAHRGQLGIEQTGPAGTTFLVALPDGDRPSGPGPAD